MPADTHKDGAGVFRMTDFPVRLPSQTEDHGDVRDGLDIVDGGRTSPEAMLGREGRLDPGVTAVPFERVHQR